MEGRNHLLDAITSGIDAYAKVHKNGEVINDIILSRMIADKVMKFLDREFRNCMNEHHVIDEMCLMDLWISIANGPKS